MNLVAHFLRQAAYDDWANREVARVLRGVSAPDALRLFVHVVATECLWLDRIALRRQRCPVWPEWTLDEAGVRLALLPAEWRECLRGPRANDLDANVAYVNSRGQHFVSSVGDIVAHAMLHGAYHRGQIARALRELGIAPAETDFIHAARSGHLDDGAH